MITQDEYQKRRQALARQLPINSIALIPAAKTLMRNGDSHFPFRQDSDFLYLCGFNEPDALLLIRSGDNAESYLFNRSRNPEAEQWDGRRLGQEGAMSELGMAAAWPIETLEEKLPELLADKNSVYCNLGKNAEFDQLLLRSLNIVKSWYRRGIKSPEIIKDLSSITAAMRLYKSDAEIELMRKAAAISVNAHRRAIQACRTLNFEYELEAELLYEFHRHGSNSPAYNPIVGSGANACVLHYNDNNQPIDKTGLVLIDAGCEYHGYAADITRTFPASGRFSPEQKLIYELVLKAQQTGLERVKPGNRWHEVQMVMVRVITEGLCELGLLSGNPDELIEKGEYRKFYMHNSGHWLGLDVHDCGSYKIEDEWRSFEPGMVLTVEPGIYIAAGTEGVESRWWNIGIRIEDDILVTMDGYDNLTSGVPVEVDEIEALMSETN